MNKICVAIPYFGSWPSYFYLFLESCRANPNIDFLFFTDLKLNNYPPLTKNIIVNSMTFDSLINRIEHKLDIKLAKINPYKLCDYRPAFGIIFQEYFSRYDYWGWCDIDIILGMTSKYLKNLFNFDIWCVRKYWTTGSWTLLNNINKINNLYLNSPDWRKVFQSPINWAFDECAGAWHPLEMGLPPEKTNSPIISFTHIIREEIEKGNMRGHFNDIAYERVPQHLRYNGKLIDNKNREYFLFHLFSTKYKWLFIYPNWHNTIPQCYLINRFGFFPSTPSCMDIILSLFSANSFFQIKDKILKRIHTIRRLLHSGRYEYLFSDLKRRIVKNKYYADLCKHEIRK